MQNKPQPIPEVGKTYKFFDKGRMRFSGIYDAIVTQIMTIEESKKYILKFPNNSTTNLYDFWKKEINSKVIPYRVEKHWLYERNTDYFVFCNIPEYSNFPVIFVRDIENRWFSLGYPNSFDVGLLDVSGELYNIMINTNHEN